MNRSAVVLTVSTRAAAGIYDDLTGPVLTDWCRSRGFSVDASVTADAGAADAVRVALESRPDLLLTTGGTGMAPDDATPEAVLPFLSRELPGFGEELRRRGTVVTPHALLSRSLAGIAGSTLVVCLPGSTGGVRDGLAVLDGVIDHILDQLSGGRHDTPDETPAIDVATTDRATDAVRVATVTGDPIDLDALRSAVTDATRGAVVTFEGVVRNHDEDRGVSWLSYSGHPLAEDALREAAVSVCRDFPDVVIAVAHRVGRLDIGGLALGCAVASAHRAEAFSACAALVDRVKETVPIWKEQGFDDGDVEWVQAIG